MTVVRTPLPPEPSSVPAARRFVRQAMSRGPPELVEVAELLVTELVSNAVKHACTPLTLRVEHQASGDVRLHVHDGSTTLPMPNERPLGRSHGYGLQLVDALATEWGTTIDLGHGKSVWCLIRTSSVHRDPPPNGIPPGQGGASGSQERHPATPRGWARQSDRP